MTTKSTEVSAGLLMYDYDENKNLIEIGRAHV